MSQNDIKVSSTGLGVYRWMDKAIFNLSIISIIEYKNSILIQVRIRSWPKLILMNYHFFLRTSVLSKMNLGITPWKHQKDRAIIKSSFKGKLVSYVSASSYYARWRNLVC